MTGFLIGLSCGALIGWAARVARERSRFRRIREDVMTEIARQEREREERREIARRGMDRWAVERLLRDVDEEWESTHGE